MLCTNTYKLRFSHRHCRPVSLLLKISITNIDTSVYNTYTSVDNPLKVYTDSAAVNVLVIST